ncbi:valine--tRNA ligase [Acidobacteriota bacterium]
MTDGEFPKRPDLKEIEKKWQDWWEEQELFRFDPESDAPVYSIDVPPRYVSGVLHIGHAISYTHIDFSARYHRLRGCNVFNPLCFDVNGLPIEVNVEKQGIDPAKVGRQEFISKCEEFGNANIGLMTAQFKRLGHSFDPSIYYQTNSPEYRRITQLTFIEMLEKELLYRDEHPVNFCPRCRTALSDAEIQYTERQTSLNYLKFYPESGNGNKPDGFLGIATTRPELLCACRLVAVHPSDQRYSSLVGSRVKVPLYDITVPIVADENADPKFGTGAVMVCTFGDKEDIQWIFKHNAGSVRAIDEMGNLTEAAGPYEGMTIKEAREKIIADLKQSELLTSDESLEQRVGVCWRCETPIEYIITRQWFLKIIENKERILETQKAIEWYPDYMRVRLINWIESLTWDWCISRQRYFATPIPIWECTACSEVVPATREQCYVQPVVDDPPVPECPSCGGEIKGSEEVFDTWFDSSITPIYNSFWGRDEDLHNKIFPMDLRPQAHDIIRTWAFYTIARSDLLTGKPPFRHVAVSGFILGPDGRPMHTSWGNVVDPLEVIEKMGTEPLRYCAALCGLGVDTSFNWETTDHGSDFCIKLWNIARFISTHIAEFEPRENYTTMDRWILSELSQLIKEVTECYDTYSYDRGLRLIERFAWNRLADNYLEVVKHRLYGADSHTARNVLYKALLAILKMLSPILPHITEELYQHIFAGREEAKSIHISAWPELDYRDEDALSASDLALKLISLLRNLKREKKIRLGAQLEKVILRMPSSPFTESVLPEVKGTLRIDELVVEEGEPMAARLPDESF